MEIPVSSNSLKFRMFTFEIYTRIPPAKYKNYISQADFTICGLLLQLFMLALEVWELYFMTNALPLRDNSKMIAFLLLGISKERYNIIIAKIVLAKYMEATNE